MGTLFSALNIGRAGLLVAQVQLDTAGHNIANVNKEGFSRQRVNVTTRFPNMKPYGAIGRGAAVDGIERIREAFLDAVFRRQVPGLNRAAVQASFFSRIEDTFLEPGDDGFSARLGRLFDALQDFSVNVENMPTRVALISEAQAATSSLNEVSQRLALLRRNANEEVGGLVGEINSITARLADSNRTISLAEVSGRTANDLRDDRDFLLDELARIVDIETNQRDDGQVDVFLGGEELVTGRRFRLLEAVPDPTIDPTRPEFLRVQYSDTGLAAQIVDGELAGAIFMRDVEILNIETRMDELAAALIEGMNSIHSQGNGLANINGPLVAGNAVSVSSDPLNLAGLPFTATDGSFDVVVYDDITNGVVETITVSVVASGPLVGQTSLDDIQSDIDGATNLSASISVDGNLIITPSAGFSFHFENDTSNTLPALGANGFFAGTDAGNIAVNTQLVGNPEFISSGFSTIFSETGDNSAAIAMAQLRDATLLEGNMQTINQFLESTIVQVGVRTRANLDRLETEQAFVDDLARRRQEISGVNIDEEVTNLLMFQRAFEASARVITVTDRMLETLVNLVR